MSKFTVGQEVKTPKGDGEVAEVYALCSDVKVFIKAQDGKRGIYRFTFKESEVVLK